MQTTIAPSATSVQLIESAAWSGVESQSASASNGTPAHCTTLRTITPFSHTNASAANAGGDRRAPLARQHGRPRAPEAQPPVDERDHEQREREVGRAEQRQIRKRRGVALRAQVDREEPERRERRERGRAGPDVQRREAPERAHAALEQLLRAEQREHAGRSRTRRSASRRRSASGASTTPAMPKPSTSATSQSAGA